MAELEASEATEPLATEPLASESPESSAEDGRSGPPGASGSPLPPTFLDGERVAGRFRIVRLLGQGAMGQVFEAWDEELATPIALKVIRPDLSDHASFAARFKEEVEIARRVTHPNVCRVFDLFSHRSADESGWGHAGPELLVLTMQLLRGETLARHVARQGSLSADQAEALAGQIADGLDAAHAAGVQHRDLKSSNIVLDRDRDGNLNPIITDFGLARPMDDRGGSMGAGTPAYAAPEIRDGAPGDRRSDIFSFGAVLYEMLVGRPPTENSAEAPRRFRRAVAGALHPDPKQRFGSAREVVDAITTRRPSRLAMAAVSTIALAAMIGLGPWIHQTREIQPLRVAYLASEPEPTAAAPWLAATLALQLERQLAGFDDLSPLPVRSVSETATALGLVRPHDDPLTPPEADRLRTALGADALVVGSTDVLPTATENRIELRLRIYTRDGSTEDTLTPLFGIASDLETLIEVGAKEIRRDLGLDPERLAASESPTAELPRTVDGARLYASAVDLLRAGDGLGAERLLEEAITLEGETPLLLTALGEAAALRGLDDRAATLAESARELLGQPRDEWARRLEAQSLELSRDWRAAADRYEAMSEQYGTDLRYALRRANALAKAGDPARAFELLTALPEELPTTRPLATLHLARARVAEQAGMFQEQADAAETAIELADTHGAEHLAARARLSAGIATLRLGKTQEAATLLDEALLRFGQLGDAWNAARALIDIGRSRIELAHAPSLGQAQEDLQRLGDREGEARLLALWAHRNARRGNLSVAEEQADRAITIAREIGNFRAEAEALAAKALALWAGTHEAAALDSYRDALQAAKASGDQRLIAGYTMNLALVLQYFGPSPVVAESFERAVAIFRRIGSRADLGRALRNLAAEYRTRRDLDRAADIAREAVETERALGDAVTLRESLVLLSGIQARKSNFEAARESIEEAITVAASIGKSHGFDYQSLARIDWKLGQREEALAAMDAILERYPAELEATDNFGYAVQLDRARILQELGRVDAGRATLLEVFPALMLHGSPGQRRGTRKTALRLIDENESSSSEPFERALESQLTAAEDDERFGDQAILAFELAAFLRQLERPEEACSLLERSLDDLRDKAPTAAADRLAQALASCV